MLTLQQLAKRVARYIQQPPEGVYVQRQVVQFLSECYHEIWDMHPWPHTIARLTNVTLPANSNTLALPKRFQSILRARQGSVSGNNGGCEIEILAMPEFSDVYRRSDQSSSAFWGIAPFGSTGAERQPPGGAQLLTLQSTDAADTAAIFIKGEDANGETASETVTLTGITPVQTTRSYGRIEVVSKPDNTAGQIIIRDSGNTIRLATIGPFEFSPVYSLYQASFTPLADTVFNIVAKLRFEPLINNADRPMFDCDLVLVSGAVKRHWAEQREMEPAAQWNSQYQSDLDDLRRRELNEDGSVEKMVPMVFA